MPSAILDISIDQRSANEIFNVFERLPVKLQKKVLPAALQAAAKPVIKAARSNLGPTTVGRYGALKKSLGTKLSKDRRKGSRVLVIGARGGAQWTFWDGDKPIKPSKYAHLVEFDTDPHAIEGRLVIGGNVVVEGVNHPGTKGKRFMTNAFDEQKSSAVRAFGDKLEVEIIKKVNKGVSTGKFSEGEAAGFFAGMGIGV